MEGTVCFIFFLAILRILLVFHLEGQRVTVGVPFATEREKRPEDMGAFLYVSPYVTAKTVKQYMTPSLIAKST